MHNAEVLVMSEPKQGSRLTLAEQLSLLVAAGMPEKKAKERLEQAFRRKEVIFSENRAVPYHDAEIDWVTGKVLLPRLRAILVPTLTEGEFEAAFAQCLPLPGGQVGDSSNAARSGYMPEYLQLIHRAIEEHKMRDDHQPKAETLQAWFRNQTVAGERISDNLARAMTTIARRPDRKRGGALKRPRKG
jgi:hypothetical protein